MSTQQMSLFDLIAAFAEPGCPVCRLVRQDVQRFLGTLLTEHVSDVSMHRAFRAGRGLCNNHAWQLAKFGGALLNIAVYYRGALKEVLRALEGAPAAEARSRLARLVGGAAGAPLADRLEPGGPCVACRARADAEALYLRTLAEHMGDERLATAYAGSDGLCLPHFRRALRLAGPPEGEALVAAQRRVWAALLAELDTFKEMHDYRHTGERMGAEGDSWLRAIRSLAGEEGVFGSDPGVA